MKVFLSPPPHLSRGIQRVAYWLARYAPDSVQIVDDLKQADHRVIHTIGWAGMGEAMASTPTYSIVQYCRESSENGSLARWGMDIWAEAKLVMSYYPLQMEMHNAALKGLADQCRFYLTPLGVETEVFYPRKQAKVYLVGTSGYVAESECIGEWADVVDKSPDDAPRAMMHLGPRLTDAEGKTPSFFFDYNGITDDHLAGLWSSCKYVNGLRRTEGFELPAAEGLCCGARPVLFARPHHIMWFGDHAEYILEGPYQQVQQRLQELAAGPYREVTDSEIQWARDRFSWEKMARGFWERLGV